MEGQKYYIDDPETGYPQEVSKAEYDRYMRLVAIFKQPLSIKETKGVISIFGTASEPDVDFSKIWEPPSAFNLLT